MFDWVLNTPLSIVVFITVFANEVVKKCLTIIKLKINEIFSSELNECNGSNKLIRDVKKAILSERLSNF